MIDDVPEEKRPGMLAKLLDRAEGVTCEVLPVAFSQGVPRQVGTSMNLPINYLPVADGSMRVRVFHGQSQTVGRLDGFTLARNGVWINLSGAITFSELATIHMRPQERGLYSINLDGCRLQLETHGVVA